MLPSKPVIIPIISPNLSWDALCRAVKNHTGDSINQLLDFAGIPPGQNQSAITALAAFRGGCEIQDPYLAIREAGVELQQFHFSFLCIYKPIIFTLIALYTDLKILTHHSQGEVVVIGGNLLQWKRAIIDLTAERWGFETRLLMDMILLLFECNGYSQVWNGYSKEYLLDQSFTLRLKNG